jgi:hypothetical protein
VPARDSRLQSRHTKAPFAGLSEKPSEELEPSTPSLPWNRGVTRVHARSLATDFRLQIAPLRSVQMRRERSHVSFLMCPFCVRALVPREATSRVTCCARLSSTQIRSCCAGVFVHQSAESVAPVQLAWRVRTDET